MRQVVVSGVGLLSPLGMCVEETLCGITSGKSGTKLIEEFKEYKGFRSYLGAPLADFEFPDNFSAKATRSMGHGAKLAVFATQKAFSDANLEDRSDLFESGRMGVAYGSGTGSPSAILDFSRFINEKSTKGIKATTYLKMMSHTCATNISIFYGITGRIIPTSCACSSGSIALGYGYESIKYGAQEMMLAGGAEEFNPAISAIFDTLYASSANNSAPQTACRPFDSERDGLIVGEGACSIVLEEKRHALSRGIKPLAELVGFSSNSDGYHMTLQKMETIAQCMEEAIIDAKIDKSELGYICAHATGTVHGDSVESKAIERVFPNGIPVSSLKGHLGHSLGGSGSSTVALCIAMMNRKLFSPTRNLNTVAQDCAKLDYIIGENRCIDTEYIMVNNFAFGGVNASLIFKRLE